VRQIRHQEADEHGVEHDAGDEGEHADRDRFPHGFEPRWVIEHQLGHLLPDRCRQDGAEAVAGVHLRVV